MGFELEENNNSVVNIVVIGVGGGGNNAINHMMDANIHGVHYLAVNTDKQVLAQSNAQQKINIGEKVTKGLGAGGDPTNGSKAAEESAEEIMQAIKDADMVFVTAGMGGGTGTGAAPVIARIAREMDKLTIGVVTKPFLFEGKRRMMQAEEGIKQLAESVDSLIVVPNEKLKQIPETRLTLANAFKIADDVLCRGVRSISELVTVKGYINLDFADVSSVMKNAGNAHMGIGSAQGKDKAQQAVDLAISSPLLETSIKGAKGLLVMITGSPDITLEEVDIATNAITNEASPDANIIFGTTFDETLEDEMRVTVIATGFDSATKEYRYRPAEKIEKKPEQTFRPETEDLTANFFEDRPDADAASAARQPSSGASISEEDFGDIMDLLNNRGRK